MKSKVGIVVPTLGKRPDFLSQCLKSIQAAASSSKPFVIIVAPTDSVSEEFLSSGLVDKFVQDPGTGLPEAINAGFAEMPTTIEYINWLGDDDLLAPNALDMASSYLDNHPETVLVFGGCSYIDPNGQILWTNKSGSFAVPLLRFGPDLIPQPGALFRKTSFEKVDGLDSRFDWAFDFDLLIKLSKIGRLSYLDTLLSSFRWHPESLSVEYRKKSVAEASRVRVSHLPAALRPISFVWEIPVRLATLVAGNRVTSKSKKRTASL